MLVLHRFQPSIARTLRPLVLRTNATLTEAPVGSELSPPPPQPVKQQRTASASPKAAAPTEKAPAGEEAGESKTQGRKKRKYTIPTRRPAISTANPREWNRPLGAGVVPAYDLALAYIQADKAKLREEVEELKARIDVEEQRYQQLRGKSEAEGENEAAATLDAELEKMREKLVILEVQSEVNLPDVRWKVANAMVDMSKASHRHLVEQKWRKDGDLDLLMERVYQMKVVPDVLPQLRPSVDLHLVAKALPTEVKQLNKLVKMIEPGSFLLPSQTLEPPRLYPTVFHTDTRLYTMMLVDPDVPDAVNASFTTYLHWLKPNIPLSSSHASQILDLNTHTQYLPPHPHKGTAYHRYTVLLLPQPPLEGPGYSCNTEARAQPGVPTSKYLDIPVVPDDQRLGFNVRDFCKEWGLNGKRGGGVHMFREIWDEDVSKIYTDILKQEEPRYGRPPKFDPYALIKNRKKYTS